MKQDKNDKLLLVSVLAFFVLCIAAVIVHYRIDMQAINRQLDEMHNSASR